MKFQYRIIRSNRKTIGIEAGNGMFTVRAPYGVTDAVIEEVLSDKRSWLEKQQKRMDQEAEQRKPQNQLSEKELLLLGIRAKAEFEIKVEKYSKMMNVSWNKITIRCQKTRWGSCTSNGNLSFNVLLMLAPEEVRDYVIIHELCHRKVMNHSGDFYSLMDQYCPNWKEHRNWLKENGAALQSRISREP